MQWGALCLRIGTQGIQAGLATCADRDLRTGAGKCQRHFTTDALAAAGDQHAATGEVEGRGPIGDPALGRGQIPGGALTRSHGRNVCHHRSNLMPWASGSESE